jgi:hypothetical protein
MQSGLYNNFLAAVCRQTPSMLIRLPRLEPRVRTARAFLRKYCLKSGTIAKVERSFINQPRGYMKKLAFIVAVLVIGAGPATAQSQEDQSACTPDVMRLCQQDIPDHGRIIACLVRSKLQLSPACSGVFNRARTATVLRTKL